jgi:hypothetical protein
MLTAPIVDKTGRSLKKNANMFKGVVANRTMEGTGRLVHMKLRVHVRGSNANNERNNAKTAKRGLTEGAKHGWGSKAPAPPSSSSIQTCRLETAPSPAEAWPALLRPLQAQKQAAKRLKERTTLR